MAISQIQQTGLSVWPLVYAHLLCLFSFLGCEKNPGTESITCEDAAGRRTDDADLPAGVTGPTKMAAPMIEFSVETSEVVRDVRIDPSHPPVVQMGGTLLLTNNPIEMEDGSGGKSIFPSLSLVGEGVVENHTSSVGEFSCRQMMPSIHILWANEETVILDARVTCALGESIAKTYTVHLIVLVDMFPAEQYDCVSRVLFSGRSREISNDGQAFESEAYEFYVEAQELAIYRHAVAWCDREGLMESRGISECTERPRTLTVVQRIPLSPDLSQARQCE